MNEEPQNKCPTPCDADCDAPCHEAHDIMRKRQHDVEACERRQGIEPRNDSPAERRRRQRIVARADRMERDEQGNEPQFDPRDAVIAAALVWQALYEAGGRLGGDAYKVMWRAEDALDAAIAAYREANADDALRDVADGT